MTHNLPILYSFRRCPYAMRARLGLQYAKIKVELREVVLKDKPAEMIAVSPKATVPVLLLPEQGIIDESYDIIKWAISQNDPDHWQESIAQSDDLVKINDGTFKTALDKYKYASRFPEQEPAFYRSQGEVFLNQLDQLLRQGPFLLGEQERLADIAIFPFIRQFAHVDRAWFFAAPYPQLHRWFKGYLNSEPFTNIMNKYTPWQQGNQAIYFPDSLNHLS